MSSAFILMSSPPWVEDGRMSPMICFTGIDAEQRANDEMNSVKSIPQNEGFWFEVIEVENSHR